jgi:hypothetical protein
MRDDKPERTLMQLAQTITSWDKIDANQIINDVNLFFEIIEEFSYSPKDFGVTQIPSSYIPKLLKESGLVLATDKQKQCIFGDTHPYKIYSVNTIKKTIKKVESLS